MKKNICVLASLLLFLYHSFLHSQPADLNWSTAILQTENVFSDLNTNYTPGCSVGVIHQGKYIFTGNYGMANLEHNIPINSDTVFQIGSVSKQFTATAIAILVQRGEVDLDVDIHTYLQDLAEYEYEVTIRQIIHHLGGIPDYENLGAPFLNASGNAFRFGNEDYYTINEFYEVVKTLQLENQPESVFSYSNTGYFILSKVVESVTGLTLSSFAQQEIFYPLGMEHSSFVDNVNQIIPNRADGYKTIENDEYETFKSNLDFVGDDGVHTTLNDFLYWDINFYDNHLGNEDMELISLLETPHEFFENIPPSDMFAGGDLSPYAWGMIIMEHRVLKLLVILVAGLVIVPIT